MANTTLAKPTAAPAPSPSAELRMPKEVEEWFQTLSPGLFQNYKEIESTWNYPLTQFSVQLVGDSQFRAAVTEMANQPHGCQRLATYEVFLVLAIWVLRSWRLSKAPTLLVKLWTQFWISCVFWLFSLVFVPLMVWGTAYKTVIGQSVKALLRHFL